MGRKNKYKKIKPKYFQKNLANLNRNKLPKELAAKTSDDYVLINQCEMDMLSRYILDYKNIETGGQLFGYWTFDGKPVVLFVLGPGPNAGHYNAFFMQDLDYLRSCARLLKQKYGLDHIGEWHSHHQLGLAHPSGHDAHNMTTNLRRLGYQKFLLCIGVCTETSSSINAFMFINSSNQYTQVPWLIKDIDSPYRKLIDANGGECFELPAEPIANMKKLFLKEQSRRSEKINYNSTYWLKRDNNSKVLKRIIDSLKTTSPLLDCVPTVDENQEVHLEMYQDDSLIADIHFPKDFPVEPPFIIDDDGNRLIGASLWNYDGDIYNSFINYYIKTKRYSL